MEPFDDHLCDLKLKPANKRLHEEAGKCWSKADAEVQKTGNYARLYPAFVECHLESIRTYVEQIERVARDVCRAGGNDITPDFIRNVLRPRVFSFLETRRGTVQQELIDYSIRTRQDTTRGQHHLAQEMNRLRTELSDKYEAETIELDSAQSRQKTDSHSHGTEQDGRMPPSGTREELLKPVLKRKGFSVHDWANAAKVDFHTANNYLAGKTNPHPSTRKKLADGLGLKPKKLPD